MCETSKKVDNYPNEQIKYSPIILPESPAVSSPQKNLTGLPRIVRDLVADLYNNIQKWNDFHIKGCQIVKEIAAIKSNNPTDYSPSLEKCTLELYNIAQNMKNCLNLFDTCTSQMESTTKLDKTFSPIFISHNLKSLSDLFKNIVEAYKNEFKIKEMVLENIAHSKNESEAMFLAVCWTYQTNITDNINVKLEILLLETGHRRINV